MNDKKIKQELKEKNELIAELEEGISNEIDNLRGELKKIKEKNKFFEERDNDFQKNFEADRKIFKNQLEEIEILNKDKSKNPVHIRKATLIIENEFVLSENKENNSQQVNTEDKGNTSPSSPPRKKEESLEGGCDEDSLAPADTLCEAKE